MNSTTPLSYLDLADLWDADIPEREPMLGKWLTDYHLGMIYAPSGVGKSMFAMSLALTVAGGGEYLGWQAHTPQKVMIIDGEMDVIDLKERAIMLASSIPDIEVEAAKQNLTFLAFQGQETGTVWPDISDASCHPTIIKKVQENSIKLLILDNLSTLASVADENSASSWNEVLDLLRLLKREGCTVLLIHHSRKGKVSEGSYRGSQKLSVLLQSIIQLDHADGVPSMDGAAFQVTFEKLRGERSEETSGIKAHLKDGTWEWEQSNTTQAYQVVAIIRERECKSQTEVAAVMNVAKGTISKWVTSAVSQGLITRDEIKECFKDAASDDNKLQDDF